MLVQSNLKIQEADLQELCALVEGGSIACNEVERQSDGDIRYWNVDTSQLPILANIKSEGERLFASEVGRPPAHAFIMINDIEPSRSPSGSGGGWHLDSYKKQYKFFVYLTDVDSEANGAFAFFPQTHSWWFRAYALAKRVLRKSVRYSDSEIATLKNLGQRYTAVIGKRGTNFFLDTSYLHRGLPIRTGRRLLATLYMFEDMPDAMQAKMMGK